MVRDILKKAGLENTIVYSMYMHIYDELVGKRREKKLHAKMHTYMNKYGLESLNKLYTLFNSLSIDIWFEYGTMLGAYREHGFIPYDYDIDLGMYAEDFTPLVERKLFDAGFSIKRMFYKIENMDPSTKQLTEVTLDYKGLSIDIFLYFKEDSYRYGYVYAGSVEGNYVDKNMYVARLAKMECAPIDSIDFLGIKFGMPHNAEDCLKKLYGATFMTPLKNSSFTKSKKTLPYTDIYGEMFGSW